MIPLGTRVWVEGYGEAIAGDTGGAIKGHKIDVFISSYDLAMEWGVKKVKIKVYNSQLILLVLTQGIHLSI